MFSYDDVLILFGENWCWSFFGLIGFRGVSTLALYPSHNFSWMVGWAWQCIVQLVIVALISFSHREG